MNCFRRNTVTLCLGICFAILCFPFLSCSQQVADTSYTPPIANPEYSTCGGPRVYIDEGHNNFHTKEGRYKAFSNLLERDGYKVESYQGIFKTEKLDQVDILVISNALHESNINNWTLPTPSAFTDEEIKVLNAWVSQGGSLFVIADHMPFAGCAEKLASSFGFGFTNGYVAGENGSGRCFFSKENGSLADCPLTQGRNETEKVDRVATFTGQAFTIPEDADPILTFKGEYTNYLPDTAGVFNQHTKTSSANGLSQGAIKRHGKGRIAVFGEAAMFTAQLSGTAQHKAGMNTEDGAENYKLLLNLIHWLDGKLNNESLIPRAALFTDNLINEVQLCPFGEQLLYTESSSSVKKYFIRSIILNETTELGSSDEFYNPKFDASGNVLLFRKGKDVKSFLIRFRNGQLQEVPLSVTVDGGYALFFSKEDHENTICFFLVDGQYSLYNLNINTGNASILGQIKHSFYSFDSDLNLVAASSTNEQGGISFFRRSQDEWKEFLSHEWDEGLLLGRSLNQIISSTTDGQYIYSISRFDSDKTNLYRTETKSGNTELLLSHEDFDLYGKEKWISSDGKPLAIAYYDADLKWIVLDKSIQNDVDLLRSSLGSFSFLSRTHDDRKWLIKRLSGGPIEYLLYDRDDKTLQSLISECPEVERFTLGKRIASSYQTADGFTFPYQLYLPPGTELNTSGVPNTPLPTIIYVHGGPWVGFLWDSWYTNRNLQLLANRGYAVLAPDFRGSLGYGKEVVDASNKEWGKAMHQDIVELAKHSISKRITAKDQLGIFGWSYGGYETMFALADMENSLFTCGIAEFGPSDLLSFLDSELGSQNLWKLRVGDLQNDSTNLKSVSPLFLIDQYKAPILISHGKQDPLVPIDQSDNFVSALIENKKQVEYISFKNEGHDYIHKANHESFWAVAESFLKEHMNGLAQQATTELENENIETLIISNE